MYRYLPVKETASSDELGTYDTWGIRVSHITESDSKEIRYISDVSVNYDSVELFTRLCNEQQLDPIHLSDAIDDIL